MARGRPAGSKNKKSGGGKKRGKSEAMTGAKENAVEMRKAELDLQPIEIDDGDFDMHLRAMKGAVDKQKTAKNLYDGCCKAAKKVSPELLDAIKRAIKFEGMDREDIKRQLEIDGYVLKKTGSSVQLTIHDTILGDVKDAAYGRGKADALNGRGSNSPYPAGSDLTSAYDSGWQDGTGQQLGLTPEQTAAAIDDDDALPDHDHNERNGMTEEMAQAG